MLANTLSFPFMKSTVYALKRHVTFADQEVVSMGGWGPRDNFFFQYGAKFNKFEFFRDGGMGPLSPRRPRVHISLFVMKCYIARV